MFVLVMSLMRELCYVIRVGGCWKTDNIGELGGEYLMKFKSSSYELTMSFCVRMSHV